MVNRRPDPPARVSESVPLDLDRIILKCLEKNPDYRYQTPTDLLVDLRKLSRDTEAADWTTDSYEKPETGDHRLIQAENHNLDVTPPPSAEVVDKSDIFINCSQVDDRIIGGQSQGWVGS